MSVTPPPILKHQPPPMPVRQPPVIQTHRGTSGNALPLSLSIPIPVKLWFILAILTGLAAGRVRAEWRAIVDKDPDVTFLSYGVFAFAAFGILGIAFCLWCVMRQPSLDKFLGMKRSYWQLGTPLAWLCGVGIGLLWRYL